MINVDGKPGWRRVVKVTGEGEECCVVCARMTEEEKEAFK